MMKKNYAYAASYEDFVSLIEDCDDLNELQQIRYLHSTDLFDLKRVYLNNKMIDY